MPQAIAQAQSFDGRIEYDAARTDVPGAPIVHGVLDISGPHWQLAENGPGYLLNAGDGGARLHSASGDATLDDPFEADALANPWAIVLGRLHAERWSAVPGSARIWTSSSNLRAYLDPTGQHVDGIDDRIGSQILSLTFDGWTDVDGLDLPQGIVRLRNGAAVSSFSVVRYSVLRLAPQRADAVAQPLDAARHQTNTLPALTLHPMSGADASAGWSNFFRACEFLLLAILIVAWLRRDAFLAGACRRLARDPRAFKDEGISVFVSPEGTLYFDGCEYRVGAQYYSRPTTVQTSPLFLRVSAKGVTHAVVLPRRLPPPQRALARTRMAASVRGLSLIEVLVAMSIFTLVVVAGVYPTLILIAKANAFAATRAAAIRLAENALTDEEAACAYGAVVADGTATTSADGLTVAVTVRSSAVTAAHDILVDVTDAGGFDLVRLATTVGPPVPVPSQPPGAAGSISR